MKRIFILLLATLAVTATDKKPEEAKPTSYDQTVFDGARTFAQIMQLVGEKHYNVSNAQEGMMKAMDGFVGSLDKHSAFLDEETYRSMMESTSGELIGIGVKIDNMRKTKDKFLTIVETIPDGPADKAGIESMDKIMEIEGVPLEDMPTETAISKLKGARNSQVNIKVLRDKEKDLLPFTITRDVVENESSLSFHIKNHDIYYISLSSFSSNTLAQVEKLLRESTKKHYKGIILDLRNNSGGLLTSVVDIAGLFVPKGSLVVATKDKNGKEKERYVTTRTPIANGTTPIFILINNFTASAAEILAGCLKIHSSQIATKASSFAGPMADKPHGKTTITPSNHIQKDLYIFVVGTQSYGKGSVQEVIPIENYAIKLTTSLYFLPNDTKVQGVGITPDFVIERTFPATEQMQWFTKFYGREDGIGNYIKPDGKVASDKESEKKALEKDKDKKTLREPQGDRGKDKDNKKGSGWVKRAQTMIDQDNQIRDTISLVNLFDTFKHTCPANVDNRDKAVEFLKKHHITNDKIEIETMDQK